MVQYRRDRAAAVDVFSNIACCISNDFGIVDVVTIAKFPTRSKILFGCIEDLSGTEE